ncbi:MAG: hypothetical protein HZA05_00240 [Nitrospirae bacterium]|nr:hypothetical protein [Nitrospirota bacterium]
MFKWILPFLLLFITIIPEQVYCEEKVLKIGRMKVSVWPEYDTPDVLVVYEGRFADKDAFPAQITFIFPKGVIKLTDACSLSPKGQHFCQLYDIEKKGNYNQAVMSLPYGDFFIDFQYSPFKGGKDKSFEYVIQSKYDIMNLDVNIQQPLRSSNFYIVPASSKQTKDSDFNQYHYSMKDIPANQDVRFKINYIKGDNNPSVDIKFGGMSKPDTTNRDIAILAVGVVIIVGFGVYRFLIKRTN